MTPPSPSGTTLRLVWPQWQGAQPDVVARLTPELRFAAAQLGYCLGSRLLQTIVPPHDGPEALVGVETSRDALTTTHGTLRQVAEIGDVVALTVAEYVPRQAIALQDLVARLPLLGT